MAVGQQLKCFLWILLCVIQNGQCFVVYKTCLDVFNDLGQNATDGEYILFQENGVGVEIYCHGKQFWLFG